MAARERMLTLADANIVLAVRNLKKEFYSKKGPAVQALRDVSLEARRRQVTGLVGIEDAFIALAEGTIDLSGEGDRIENSRGRK